tara:strand:+ start:277 stop:687 length:411 start_codon:yes stop_codon:yes gene_type:complete
MHYNVHLCTENEPVMKNLRHTKLKRQIFNILINNNWRVSIVLKNNAEYEGGLVDKIVSRDKREVMIVIQTDDNKYVRINLNDIRKVKAPQSQDSINKPITIQESDSPHEINTGRVVTFVFVFLFLAILLLAFWLDF